VNIIPDSINIAEIYLKSSENDKKFVNNLALFFTSMFSNHLSILEQNCKDMALKGHEVLCRITFVDDKEIFKTCLEYWTNFAKALYNSNDG